MRKICIFICLLIGLVACNESQVTSNSEVNISSEGIENNTSVEAVVEPIEEVSGQLKL